MASVSNLCSPALVYLCFSLIHIVIDIYKQELDAAFIKFFMAIILTIMLNILCERGLGIISWFIVLVPITLMSFIIVLLIYFLGFNPGQLNKIFNVNNGQMQPGGKNTYENFEINTQKRMNALNL